MSGGVLTIDWSDANSGNADVDSSFYDQITVTNTSNDAPLATIDFYYDASADGSGPIVAGGFAPHSFQFQLPNGSPGIGAIKVTVTSDIYHQISDASSSANTTVTSVAARYPDLQVENLAVSPTPLTSGESIEITWDDANTGDVPVDSAFYDNLMIDNTTTDATLVNTDIVYNPTQTGNSPIAAGSSQPQAVFVHPAPRICRAGSLDIIVTTDAGNQIFEYNLSGTGQTNNTASITVTSALADYPELVTSGVSAIRAPPWANRFPSAGR